MTGLGSKRASFESLDKMNANAALYLKQTVVGTTSACLYHATYSCVCVELNAPDSWKHFSSFLAGLTSLPSAGHKLDGSKRSALNPNDQWVRPDLRHGCKTTKCSSSILHQYNYFTSLD